MSEGTNTRFYATVVAIVAATAFGYSVGHSNGASAGNRRLEAELEKMASIASRQEKRLATVADAVGLDQEQLATYTAEDFAAHRPVPARR